MIQKIYMPEYVLVIAQACGAVGTLRKTARGEGEGCVRAKVPPAPWVRRNVCGMLGFAITECSTAGKLLSPVFHVLQGRCFVRLYCDKIKK